MALFIPHFCADLISSTELRSNPHSRGSSRCHNAGKREERPWLIPRGTPPSSWLLMAPATWKVVKRPFSTRNTPPVRCSTPELPAHAMGRAMVVLAASTAKRHICGDVFLRSERAFWLEQNKTVSRERRLNDDDPGQFPGGVLLGFHHRSGRYRPTARNPPDLWSMFFHSLDQPPSWRRLFRLHGSSGSMQRLIVNFSRPCGTPHGRSDGRRDRGLGLMGALFWPSVPRIAALTPSRPEARTRL